MDILKREWVHPRARRAKSRIGPAFWLVGTSWPANGEIDVFEGIGGAAYSSYHNVSNPEQGYSLQTPGDFTGWHVYGVW
jgi:hypothetical protein